MKVWVAPSLQRVGLDDQAGATVSFTPAFAGDRAILAGYKNSARRGQLAPSARRLDSRGRRDSFATERVVRTGGFRGWNETPTR
jgi:hypothetical protein